MRRRRGRSGRGGRGRCGRGRCGRGRGLLSGLRRRARFAGEGIPCPGEMLKPYSLDLLSNSVIAETSPKEEKINIPCKCTYVAMHIHIFSQLS